MFEDLYKRLESYLEYERDFIRKRWVELIIPELKNLSKRLNPFSGKAKPRDNVLFGTPKRRRRGDVHFAQIWGVHPNVAADPQHYPEIPEEGFHPTSPYVTDFSWKLEKPITMKKGMDVWSEFPYSIYNRRRLENIFTYKGRVLGLDDLEDINPLYSERTLVEMVADYDGLEDLIREKFEIAVQEFERK